MDYEDNPKLVKLAELDSHETTTSMIFDSLTDSQVPGICINKNCEFFDHVDPDTSDGLCDECGTNTVKSCNVLAGVI